MSQLISPQAIQKGLENLIAQEMMQLKILLEDGVDLWAFEGPELSARYTFTPAPIPLILNNYLAGKHLKKFFRE